MEYFDICDEHGLPTGKTIDRASAHRLGICHRTAHIWIARKEKGRYQLLLQKRSEQKDSFPGQYDTSAAGHIQAGDEPLTSALRELQEELGISAEPEDLIPAGTFRILYDTEFYGEPFRDNETAFVYLYMKPVHVSQLVLQEDEVETVHWFDVEEIWQARLDHAEWLCVPKGGLQLIREYLGNLDGSEQLAGRDSAPLSDHADTKISDTNTVDPGIADPNASDPSAEDPTAELEQAKISGPIRIRPAYETDFARLRQIYLEARQKAFTWQDREGFSLEDFDTDTCGEKIITALWGGRIAGFMSVWKPDSFIHCLFIDPAYQGKGIGSALLAEAADLFPQPLSLKCLQENTKALTFYQSAGWTVTEEGGAGSKAWYKMVYESP